MSGESVKEALSTQLSAFSQTGARKKRVVLNSAVFVWLKADS
jgi:hypothetical protein